MTLRALAGAASLSVGHLWAIENGKQHAGEQVIKRLARALDVSVAYLMGERMALPSEMHPELHELAMLLEQPQVTPETAHAVLRVVRDMAELVRVVLPGGKPEAAAETAEDSSDIADLLDGVLSALSRPVSRPT